MALYRAEGVVLRTYRLGESDRIVVVLTRGRGKVRAVAKGVRKTTSRFGARLEPGSAVALQLYEGRELDTITQAETWQAFRTLRADLDRLSRAMVVLEAVDTVAQEGHADARLVDMVLGALGAIDRGAGATVVPAFLLRLLAHEGLAPEVQACVECGATEELTSLDVASGGVRCASCRAGATLAPGTLGLLQDVLGGRLGAVLAAGSSPASAELESLAVRWFEHHTERRLRSRTTT